MVFLFSTFLSFFEQVLGKTGERKLYRFRMRSIQILMNNMFWLFLADALSVVSVFRMFCVNKYRFFVCLFSISVLTWLFSVKYVWLNNLVLYLARLCKKNKFQCKSIIQYLLLYCKGIHTATEKKNVDPSVLSLSTSKTDSSKND